MPATTMAITRIQSSYIGINTVPSVLEVWFDARFSSLWNPDSFCTELEKRVKGLGFRYEIQIGEKTDVYLTKDDNFIKNIASSVEKIT
jgi:acetylornithine deacetylase/succinyl-diaminopimelate desuccinylase-like protein